MVFFSCNVCNESLKKNQVDKHLMKCRRCEFLSCIDCGKEFWGDSYQNHIKCVSEEEKYSGKNYVAKPNKGEVKQEQWIQKVQTAIQKAPANPQLKNLLQRLEEFPNVPRKKTKFENFLKCSLRVLNRGLVNQVWDLLMAEAQQQNGSSSATNTGSESKPPQPSASETDGEAARPAETADPEAEEPEKKLSKRERKEQRQKKTHKAEKKDRQAASDSTPAEGEEDTGKKKKEKRRKREEEEEEEDAGEVVSQPKKKKRRKGENGVAMDTQETGEENGDGGDSQDDTLPATEKKGKFNWGATIIAVLQAKGEISVKKLQKKVLAEYASYGSSKPEERVQAKFHKKLSKLPNVKVLKDKARLLSS